MVDTNKLTLLILTPDYPDKENKYVGSIFVKEQVEGLKKYFKNIFVIAPVLCSFGILSNDKYCYDYSYDNVRVFYPRCFFIPKVVPILSDYRKLYFDLRYYVTQSCIKDNKLKFDIIHSHFTFPSSYSASLLKQQYNIPYVMTVNEDSGWLDEELQLDNQYIKQSWKSANKIITINKFDNNKLSIYNNNRVTIPYSFNKQYFKRNSLECRKMLNLSNDDKILFSFGIFQRRKGFTYLIDAMNIIKNSRSDIHCYIGGKPEIERAYGEVLKDMVVELDLDNVHFTGFLNSDDIPLWMNACDLYVSSSVNEGLGITQIEAIACGKPVIATNTNGSRSIITNDDIGLLCQSANANDLASKILLGLNKKWDSDRILQFSERYRQENISNQLLKVYREVLTNDE